MEQIMNINKIIIYLTIVTLLIMIGIPTVQKIIKENEQNKYLVMEKLITESAEKCLYENHCKSNIITLKELYEKKYLFETVIDPNTKIVLNENSYVEIKKTGTNLVILN